MIQFTNKGEIEMATMTANHFDALDYVKKSKELGVPEQVAEYQARQIEQSIDIAVGTIRLELERKDLATKKDIKELELKIETVRTEISQASNKIILWVAGLFVASGLIQHFFK
jgi:hypothetical protein